MADIISSLTNFALLRSGVAKASSAKSSRAMWILGEFTFSRDTAAPQTLSRSAEYTWPAQERLSRAPALQFTGPGTESIDLDGVIYPEYRGGLAQVSKMRELAGLGKPLMLVDGRGTVYGKWVILRVEETGSVFFENGTPRKIEFRLSLQRYGEDK